MVRVLICVFPAGIDLKRLFTTANLTALASCFLFAGLATGCAQAVREAAREAAPPGVQATLTELTKPENQQKLNQIAEGPGVKQLGTSVGMGVGEGIVERLMTLISGMLDLPPETTQPATGQSGATWPNTTRSIAGLPARMLSEAAKPAGEVTTAVTGAITREVARAAREDLGPAAATAIRDHVAPAVGQMLREQVVPAVGATIREQITPAIQQLIREDAGPAIREMAHQAAAGAVDGIVEQRKTEQGTLSEASRQIAKGGALGARDAIVEANIPPPTDPLKDVAKTLEHFIWLATGLLAVAGVLALGLLIGLSILGYAVWKGRVPSQSSSIRTS